MSPKARKAHQFLVAMEQAQTLFTLEDLANASGWTRSTVDAYRTKKLADVLVREKGGFRCRGLSSLADEGFLHRFSQSVRARPLPADSTLDLDDSELQVRLREKSIEAYIAALEAINRLSMTYRVENFAYLICNAWELLLKCKMLADGGDIYYPPRPGERPRTLALRDCLKKVIPREHDPTRRNVERVADLRDDATHLVISKIPNAVLALFQACVLNYHHIGLRRWFGISLSDRVPVGMMVLVYDLSPNEFDLASPRLRRELGKDAAEYLLQFQAELQEEFERLGKPAEFSIPLDYRLVLTKREEEADITLSAGPGGDATRVVEVLRDAGRTHPFRQIEVKERVNERTSPYQVNQYDLQCVRSVYGVERRPEFYHLNSVPGSPKQYSQAYVDWLIRQHERDPQFFSKAREKAKLSQGPGETEANPQ